MTTGGRGGRAARRRRAAAAAALGPTLCALVAGRAAADAAAPAEDGAAPVVRVERALREAARLAEAGEAPAALVFGDGSDWVHMASGEWFRGTVDGARDDLLDFDSEELGPVVLNLRDVLGVHAPAHATYIFDDRSALRGPALITEARILVHTAEGVRIRPREALAAIVEGGAREAERWTVVWTAGVGLNRGNSRQVDVTMGLRFAREVARSLLDLRYLTNLGWADGAPSVAQHLLAGSFRFWWTERLFSDVFGVRLVSDRFQNVAVRFQPSTEVGVRFVQRRGARWNLSAGVGYQLLGLSAPAPGVESPQHDGIATVHLDGRTDVTDDFYVVVDWFSALAFTEIGQTNHVGVVSAYFEVTNLFEVGATFLFLRTETPNDRDDGEGAPVPVRPNDFRLTLALALEIG